MSIEQARTTVRNPQHGGASAAPSLAPSLFLQAEEAARDMPRCGVCKRLFDIVAAFLLIIALSPVFIGVSIAVLFSGRPVVYRHKRVGRGGREFYCLKFRTMIQDADKMIEALCESDPAIRAEWEANFKIQNDPRVTRVGRFLRKTSLDELPQLFNVLRGDMSLVGPRPIVRDELTRYGRKAVYYLSVRPGVTGLWQVSGRSDTAYSTRIAMDALYVRRRSFMLDLWVLWQTAVVVVGRSGAY